MSKKLYHHGDLKKSLILNGLKLLNEKGVDEFSLRKVAAMSNVSHNAPYKHFKNKEELINAIGNQVVKEFEESLIEIVKIYNDNPLNQIVELGKRYVNFFVENPDYLRFLFLEKNQHSINVKNNAFEKSKSNSFEIFKISAINFLKNSDVEEKEYTENIMSMWAIVHGISVLLVNGTLKYDGNVSDLVEHLIMKELGM